MMSSVTDRPYWEKSIYRRRRVFVSLSRSLCVVVKFRDTDNKKTLFYDFARHQLRDTE